VATLEATRQATTTEAIASSPATHNGLVFGGSLDGNLSSSSAATNSLVEALATTGPVVSSPFGLGSQIYVGSRDGTHYGRPNFCGPGNAGICHSTMSVPLGRPFESSPIGRQSARYVGVVK
jgi:hypothetical protein